MKYEVMKLLRNLRFFFIFMLLLLLSCSLSQFGWKEEGEQQKRPGKKETLVEDFDPLTLNDDDLVITPIEPDIVKEAPVVPESIDEVDEVQENVKETIMGYRVQVLLTGSEEQAGEATKKARMRFQENVYRVFETPYWKIRVGDCTTRKEAELLKEVAEKNGYPDAWIVPSEVIQEQKEKTTY